MASPVATRHTLKLCCHNLTVIKKSVLIYIVPGHVLGEKFLRYCEHRCVHKVSMVTSLAAPAPSQRGRVWGLSYYTV